MSDYKYLIIGGNGFIGINIIKFLLNTKKKVYCIDAFDSNTKNIVDKNFESYIDDLTDEVLLSKLIKKSDIIIFLASISNVRSSSNESLIELDNIKSFINFLEILKNFPNKKIVYASSGGTVYGEQTELSKETTCTNPISPYAIGKVAMENFLKHYSSKYNFKYLICRYSNPYGIFQNPLGGVGVISKILYDYYVGNRTDIIKNTNDSIRDYIYISDLVDATIKLSESELTNNQIFNVGSGVGTSLFEILNEIKILLGDNLKLNEISFGNENVSKSTIDITKLKDFGWNPKISLKEGIRLNNKWILSFLEEKK